MNTTHPPVNLTWSTVNGTQLKVTVEVAMIAGRLQ